jgi:hypothetical protein
MKAATHSSRSRPTSQGQPGAGASAGSSVRQAACDSAWQPRCTETHLWLDASGAAGAVQPFARDVAHHDAAGDGLRGKKVGVSSTVGSSSVWGGGGAGAQPEAAGLRRRCTAREQGVGTYSPPLGERVNLI